MQTLIRYTQFASPLGPIFLARGVHGICRVQLGGSEEDFRRSLGSTGNGNFLKDENYLRDEYEALRRYFSEGSSIDGIPVEFMEGTTFERRVWDALRAIPQGEVRSYGWISSNIGKPNAARAVGGACGSNPIPIIVPCHRVVASDGRLGGYGYGLDVKRRLLELEGLNTEKLDGHKYD